MGGQVLIEDVEGNFLGLLVLDIPIQLELTHVPELVFNKDLPKLLYLMVPA